MSEIANAERHTYLSITEDEAYPKHRIVFKSGRHLNLFGVKKIDLSGSWTRVWDRSGDCFMYDPASVDYIEIKDRK